MSDDPRIVHVASELSVPLGPEAENDGNREYVIDVIAAVDYANEMCDRDFAAGVQAAGDAVANVPVLLVDVRFNPDDASRYVGAVNVMDALAAIDALLGESNG